eukprot:TRINITY_DN4986_c0_g1_i2.p1 TRINITY_DN4986_c0_g1~~TRINITY_DN4986_c0_g1_i2.p1  ORF type:complete len:650 (+),score=123.36 TRINITY_DN4986_c0_g1_i2:121-2070(+)
MNQQEVGSEVTEPVNVVPTLQEIKDNLARELYHKPSASSHSLASLATIALAQNFAVGATASAIGATAVYPVDLVKTRLQNQRSSVTLPSSSSSSLTTTSTTPTTQQPRMGAWACFRNVIATEGARGLYKGLIPQLVGQVPEKAMRMVVVEQVRRALTSDDDDVIHGGGGSSHRVAPVKLSTELAAGLCGGTVQVLITNPAEIIKVRMQVQGEEITKARIAATNKGLPVPTTQAKGMVAHLRDLGVGGMYRGASACFLRDIPFSGIYFSTFAAFKEKLSRDDEPLRWHDLLLSASAAGIAAASVTTPADVLKTRMQVEAKKGEQTYSGLFDCYRKVTRSEGHAALFKGLVPRVLRSSPQYGVMLFSYELLQRAVSNEVVTSSLPHSTESVPDARWVKMLLLEDKMGFLLENRWQPPASFAKFRGAFKHISMGGGDSIWAISLNDEPYQWTGTQWTKTTNTLKLKQLSAGNDGTVWGVDREGRAVQWNPEALEWRPAPVLDAGYKQMKFHHVTVGAKNDVWAIAEPTSTTSGPNIVNWNGQRWTPVGSERMKYISAGNDGAVWGVDKQGFTFRLRRDKMQWKQMPGSLKQVSVGNARHVWGVDSNDVVYKWTGGEWNGRWVRAGGAHGQHITVGGDGNLVSANVPAASSSS